MEGPKGPNAITTCLANDTQITLTLQKSINKLYILHVCPSKCLKVHFPLSEKSGITGDFSLHFGLCTPLKHSYMCKYTFPIM